MALGMSTYLANAILDAVCNNTSLAVAQVYAKLHIGDPGAAGTANPATETTRKAVSFGATAAGAVSNDTIVTWTSIAATGTEDLTHVSLWDDLTAGNFLASGTITSNPVVSGDTFNLPVGDIDIAFTVAS